MIYCQVWAEDWLLVQWRRRVHWSQWYSDDVWETGGGNSWNCHQACPDDPGQEAFISFVSGNMKDPLESGIRRDCVSQESFWSKVNKTIRSTRGCGLVSVGCILWRLTLVTVDDAGSNGVSFICNNGTDLDAGADTHWVQGNIWTSFVSCPGDSLICGFETKGQTLFPDNSEIDRVRFYCCSLDS